MAEVPICQMASGVPLLELIRQVVVLGPTHPPPLYALPATDFQLN